MPLPRSVARFNRKYWNKLARHFAGWMPGFGIVIHIGRTSGTPSTAARWFIVFRTEDGFIFALTYGRADWVQNVMAAGSAKLRTLRKMHDVGNPRIVSAPEHEHLPFFPRQVLATIDVPEELHVDDLT